MIRTQVDRFGLRGATLVSSLVCACLGGCANGTKITAAEVLGLVKGGADIYATTQAAKASRSMARRNNAQTDVLRQTGSAAAVAVPVATSQQAALSRLTFPGTSRATGLMRSTGLPDFRSSPRAAGAAAHK